MFEIGKVYKDARGMERKCIAIDGIYAYLTYDNGTAYRWSMSGKSVELDSTYNIPQPYPRPIIPWYPGNTAPKDGEPFLSRFYGNFHIIRWRKDDFYRVSGERYGEIKEWSPLPQW